MKRGAFLVHSPFDREHYEELSQAPNEFAIQKYMYFSLFCNLLGAREVAIQRIDTISQSSKYSYQVHAHEDTTIIGGSISAQKEQHGKFMSRIQLHDVYSGGLPQLEKAESFLREHRLLGDTTMSSLLKMRHSTENIIISRTLTLNLSVEVKQIINIVGTLIIPLYIDGGGKYKNVVREMTEYCLVMQVNF